jgi:hypothetical protein
VRQHLSRALASLPSSAAVSRCCLACTKAAEPRSGACRICAPWRRGPTVRPRPLLPWSLLGPLRRGVAAGLRATSLRSHTARVPFPAVEASSAHAALSPHSPPSAALAPTHVQLVQHTAHVLHSSPFGAGATRRPASAGRILGHVTCCQQRARHLTLRAQDTSLPQPSNSNVGVRSLEPSRSVAARLRSCGRSESRTTTTSSLPCSQRVAAWRARCPGPHRPPVVPVPQQDEDCASRLRAQRQQCRFESVADERLALSRLSTEAVQQLGSEQGERLPPTHERVRAQGAPKPTSTACRSHSSALTAKRRCNAAEDVARCSRPQSVGAQPRAAASREHLGPVLSCPHASRLRSRNPPPCSLPRCYHLARLRSKLRHAPRCRAQARCHAASVGRAIKCQLRCCPRRSSAPRFRTPSSASSPLARRHGSST